MGGWGDPHSSAIHHNGLVKVVSGGDEEMLNASYFLFSGGCEAQAKGMTPASGIFRRKMSSPKSRSLVMRILHRFIADWRMQTAKCKIALVVCEDPDAGAPESRNLHSPIRIGQQPWRKVTRRVGEERIEIT